jgi:hypothetical protein
MRCKRPVLCGHDFPPCQHVTSRPSRYREAASFFKPTPICNLLLIRRTATVRNRRPESREKSGCLQLPIRHSMQVLFQFKQAFPVQANRRHASDVETLERAAI